MAIDDEEYSEEYEIIPTTPIKRLEKRMSKIESLSSSAEASRLIEHIIELIKSNHRIVEDVIKADNELRDELSKIPGKIDALLTEMKEFMELLKASTGEEAAPGMSPEAFKPLADKINEFVDANKKTTEIQQAMLASLETIDKRLKRIYMQSAGGYQQ